MKKWIKKGGIRLMEKNKINGKITGKLMENEITELIH